MKPAIVLSKSALDCFRFPQKLSVSFVWDNRWKSYKKSLIFDEKTSVQMFLGMWRPIQELKLEADWPFSALILLYWKNILRGGISAQNLAAAQRVIKDFCNINVRTFRVTFYSYYIKNWFSKLHSFKKNGLF